MPVEFLPLWLKIHCRINIVISLTDSKTAEVSQLDCMQCDQPSELLPHDAAPDRTALPQAIDHLYA